MCPAYPQTLDGSRPGGTPARANAYSVSSRDPEHPFTPSWPPRSATMTQESLSAVPPKRTLSRSAPPCIVVAPYWPRNSARTAPGNWFQALNRLCDEKQRYAAGRLHKIAEDAPERVDEWPLQIYHIPARESGWLTLPHQLIEHSKETEVSDAGHHHGHHSERTWE